MIEVIKELSTLIKDLPDMALYILLGILFYKVFIIGSTFSFGKYVVSKLYSYLENKRKEPVEYSINDRFITSGGELGLFSIMLDLMRDCIPGSLKSSYIHERHIRFAIDAIKEKKEREKNKKSVVSL